VAGAGGADKCGGGGVLFATDNAPTKSVLLVVDAPGEEGRDKVSNAVAAPAARMDTSAAKWQQETDIIVPPRWRGRHRDDPAWRAAEVEAATCGGGRIDVERRTRAARREERAVACLVFIYF
jgi:hypothetical protein